MSAVPALRIFNGIDVVLAAVSSDTSGAAMDRADVSAIVLCGDGPDASVRVLSMTAFGPSVWTSPRGGPDAAAAIAIDTITRKTESRKADVLFYGTTSLGVDTVKAAAARAGVAVKVNAVESHGDVEAAIAAFRARRAPVRSSTVVRGEERTRSWSVALVQEPFADIPHGETLGLRVESVGDGTTALRWRAPDGTDAGLHVVLEREVSESELRLVEAVSASVVGYSYGKVPGASGSEARTRTLTLDVPCSLVRAFVDGKLPKYHVLPRELADA